jgi:hypothetical protein
MGLVVSSRHHLSLSHRCLRRRRRHRLHHHRRAADVSELVLTASGALRVGWSLVMVVVTAVCVAGACIVYTNHVQQRSDQRWCDLLASLDQPGQPPTTERGRQIQEQLHELRSEMRCG